MKQMIFIITSLTVIVTVFFGVIIVSLQGASFTNSLISNTVEHTVDEAPFSDTPLNTDTSHNISRELITIPVNLFLVSDVNLKYSTNRDKNDASRILQEMNKIWSQADISLSVRNIEQIEINSSEGASVQKLVLFLKQSQEYDSDAVNIYFTRTLDGPNGIAFPSENITFVADYTSVNDYRASSHEIGHVLGLSHTDDSRSRLLFRGVNGTDLVFNEIEVSRQEAIRLSNDSRIQEQILLPEKVLIDVPFTSQAPFGEWWDPKQDYGCEEASSLMVWHWLQETPLTPTLAKQEIIAMSDWQLTAYGDHHDTSSKDSVKFFTKYFDYQNVEHRYDITLEDIKIELAKGNVVIVPVNGETLKNPYYTPPGPLEHMIVVTGYDDKVGEVITHDPGTKRGENIRFTYENFESSLRDYMTGFKEPIEEVRSAMIVIKK